MNYQIVTNNPNVGHEFENVIFTEGSYEDVLVKVRNLVHQGFELISHPLGASIRMIFSPYRSIVIGSKKEHINPSHVEVIENSIIDYRKLRGDRNVDNINSGDYAIIDMELLEDALSFLKSDSVNNVQCIN